MSSRGWFWYIFFFIYIFPLFFSYIGQWPWPAWAATLSLFVGIVAWIIYIRQLYLQFYRKPKDNYDHATALRRNGKRVDATITKVVERIRRPDRYDDVELELQLPNLSGSLVTIGLDLVDSQPHLQRYEVGKKIALRLNTKGDGSLPWITEEGRVIQVKHQNAWLLPFTIIYAIILLIVYQYIFGVGIGWRWVTLINPWVFTPIWALFSLRSIGKTMDKMGGISTYRDFDLILYGIKTQGEITQFSQTGTYINEQPEMRFNIQYRDQKGEKRVVSVKQVVLLTEMHKVSKGPMMLLYNPKDPDQIQLLPNEPTAEA